LVPYFLLAHPEHIDYWVLPDHISAKIVEKPGVCVSLFVVKDDVTKKIVIISTRIRLYYFMQVKQRNDCEYKYFNMSKKKNTNNKVQLFNSAHLIFKLIFIKPKQFHFDFHFILILDVHFYYSNQKNEDLEKFYCSINPIEMRVTHIF